MLQFSVKIMINNRNRTDITKKLGSQDKNFLIVKSVLNLTLLILHRQIKKKFLKIHHLAGGGWGIIKKNLWTLPVQMNFIQSPYN